MQAEVSEEEVLGVRGPGAKPGFNTQYEVRAVVTMMVTVMVMTICC